jgi:cytosine/adenosine deaminase-related metal-dependent hydrolase
MADGAVVIGSVVVMAVRLFHVDHLLPGDGPPIADAAVVVDAGGLVKEVGKATEVVPRHAGATVTRVRGVAFPGLVNAHTHVELSSLRGKVPGGRGFVPWVDALLGVRSEIAPEDETEALDAAAADLARYGTVAVGDVTNSLAAVSALAREGIGGAVFHEVFGQDRAAVLRRVQGLRAELEERHPAWPSTDLSYAPAAHTLYTTHADAVRALVEAAMRNDARTSVHLAEHPGERRAIEHGDGPVVSWLEARTKQKPEWPKKPLFDHADDVCVLREGVLLVHLTEARRDELDRVAACGASVVLCPRSNLFIETKLPPLLAVREAGIEAALGTDSLASNTTLDVLAEAKALADRFPSVPAWELVQMATWNGARALGRTDLGRVAKKNAPGLYAIEGEVTDDAAKHLLRNLGAPRVALVKR